jgi:thiol-disulfide isomerase/thioredoxin
MVLLTDIKTLPELYQHLQNSTKTTIIKFGAVWCSPCKKIEPFFYNYLDNLREQFNWIIIDIDVSYDLYGFLKGKRIVTGVPCFLRFNKRENRENNDIISYVPDDILIGANRNELDQFFLRAMTKK